MTRRFNVYYNCEYCGKQSSAETGFGRWMRNKPELDSGQGIVRTDTDHTILRYITHSQGRKFQLIMDIEVKEFGKDRDPCQEDIQSFKHQMTLKNGINMHQAATIFTHKLRSKYSGTVNVRYCGYHLLQFEKTNPRDSEWIRWNKKNITEKTLIQLLQFRRNPEQPRRPMKEFLRDRHEQVKLKLDFTKENSCNSQK